MRRPSASAAPPAPQLPLLLLLVLLAACTAAANAAVPAAATAHRRGLLQSSAAPAAPAATEALAPAGATAAAAAKESPKAAAPGNATAADAAAPRSKRADVEPTPLPPCCAALPQGFPHAGVPAIIVDTKGRPLPEDQTRVQGEICTCGAPNGRDYGPLPIAVRIRGASSAREQAQKSLAFDTKRPGNATRDADVEFMGALVFVLWMCGAGLERAGAVSRAI